MIKLDSVGALELFATESSETHPNDSEDEVDSEYLGEDDNDSAFSAEADRMRLRSTSLVQMIIGIMENLLMDTSL